MALIKCTECGNMISDKAIKCPKCGAPMSYILRQKEQEKEIPKQDDVSHQKKSPVTPPQVEHALELLTEKPEIKSKHEKPESQLIQNESNEVAPKKKNNVWLIIVLCVVLLLALAVIAFLLLKKNGNSWQSPAISQHATEEAQEVAQQAIQPKKDYGMFDGKYAGKINDRYAIVANLTFIDGTVHGTYYYSSQKRNIDVKGTIRDDNSVSFKGSFDGKEIDMFQGTIDDNHIWGTWNCLVNDSRGEFYLSKSPNNQ